MSLLVTGIRLPFDEPETAALEITLGQVDVQFTGHAV